MKEGPIEETNKEERKQRYETKKDTEHRSSKLLLFYTKQL
jgi:hypothetical protein